MTRPDDDRPCFRCGRLWREHPVPGTTVCRRWIEPRGRTHEPMVARDRRDDPPPPWLAELIAADDADEAILALHREALVAIADVLDAHRPWDEQGAARKVIFALHNRNLLVEEHRGPPLNRGVRWTTDDVFPPRECEPRCLDPNCRGCHPRTAAGMPIISVATSHQRDCPTCASARVEPVHRLDPDTMSGGSASPLPTSGGGTVYLYAGRPGPEPRCICGAACIGGRCEVEESPTAEETGLGRE